MSFVFALIAHFLVRDLEAREGQPGTTTSGLRKRGATPLPGETP